MQAAARRLVGAAKFSTHARTSSATGHQPHRLVTIRVSHYNERARWALDHHRIPYEEEPWLPILSTWGVIKAGGFSSGRSDRTSTKLSTPLLITAEGRKVHDSGQIMRLADEIGCASGGQPSLFFSDTSDAQLQAAAAELAQRFHDGLGTHSRRVAYSFLLHEPELLFESFEDNCGRRQTAVMRALWPVLKGAFQRLGLTPERVARSREALLRDFDFVGERLASHRGDFIVPGDRLSAADISFAALAAPVLMVQPWEGYGGALPAIEKLPPDFQDLVRALRAHEAGQFAVRMFRTHRGERQIPCYPPLPGGSGSGSGGAGGGGGGGGAGGAAKPALRPGLQPSPEPAEPDRRGRGPANSDTAAKA